jgi:hypothetical protein
LSKDQREEGLVKAADQARALRRLARTFWSKELAPFLATGSPADLHAILRAHGPAVLADPRVQRLLQEWWLQLLSASTIARERGERIADYRNTPDLREAHAGLRVISKGLISPATRGRKPLPPASFDPRVLYRIFIERLRRARGDQRSFPAQDADDILRHAALAPANFKHLARKGRLLNPLRDPIREVALAATAAALDWPPSRVRRHIWGRTKRHQKF